MHNRFVFCSTFLLLISSSAPVFAARTAPITINENMGRLEITIDALQGKLQLLNGRIEELEYKLEQNEKQMTALESQLDSIITQYGPQATENQEEVVEEEVPVTPKENQDGNVKNLADPNTRPSSPSTPVREEQNSSLPKSSTEIKSELEGERLFNEAKSFLEKKQYSEAEEAWKKWVKKFPKHSKTGDSYYWLGDLAFMKEDFHEASVQFLKSYQAEKKGQKAPHALLKLSLSLLKLEKNKACCTTLQELKKEYPSPDFAFKSQIDHVYDQAGCGKKE